LVFSTWIIQILTLRKLYSPLEKLSITAILLQSRKISNNNTFANYYSILFQLARLYMYIYYYRVIIYVKLKAFYLSPTL